jgi:hypothetical protein
MAGINIWKGGTWERGIWESGVWENGTWEDGLWLDGTWKDGNWESGTWENGIWESGWIFDPYKKGNYQPGWEWDGRFVKSPINPKEYFKKNN